MYMSFIYHQKVLQINTLAVTYPLNVKEWSYLFRNGLPHLRYACRFVHTMVITKEGENLERVIFPPFTVSGT
jgi:hypothetical protein